MQVNKLLSKHKAAGEFENWAIGKSWNDIFINCPKGEWLLWLFQKTNPEDIRLLTLAKGHCANTMRYFIQNEKTRYAIDAAIDYGKGKISLIKLNSFIADAAALVTYYEEETDKINEHYVDNDYGFDSEYTVNSNFYEAVMDRKGKAHDSNVLHQFIAELGFNAVDITLPAQNIANYTSECIYMIVEDWEPFKLVDYKMEKNPRKPSKMNTFKTMYSNYLKNTVSANISDTAEIAKIKNQLATADICRKFLPIKIWNISFVK